MVSSNIRAEIESIRLRIKSVMRSHDPDKVFVVAFVGATPRSGVSTMSVAIARSFSEADMNERTLLLGISGRGRSVDKIARAKKVPVPANDASKFSSKRASETEDGADDASEEAAETEAAPTVVAEETALPHVFRAVKRSKRGFDVLNRDDPDEIRDLFRPNSAFWPEVAQRYKVAFIDSGLVGSEPHILASNKADLTLLVVDGNKINRSELTRLSERLDQAEMSPDGVILNSRKDYLPRIFRAAVE